MCTHMPCRMLATRSRLLQLGRSWRLACTRYNDMRNIVYSVAAVETVRPSYAGMHGVTCKAAIGTKAAQRVNRLLLLLLL